MSRINDEKISLYVYSQRADLLQNQTWTEEEFINFVNSLSGHYLKATLQIGDTAFSGMEKQDCTQYNSKFECRYNR